MFFCFSKLGRSMLHHCDNAEETPHGTIAFLQCNETWQHIDTEEFSHQHRLQTQSHVIGRSTNCESKTTRCNMKIMLAARNHKEMKANKARKESMRCNTQRRRKMRAEFLLGDISRIADIRSYRANHTGVKMSTFIAKQHAQTFLTCSLFFPITFDYLSFYLEQMERSYFLKMKDDDNG